LVLLAPAACGDGGTSGSTGDDGFIIPPMELATPMDEPPEWKAMLPLLVLTMVHVHAAVGANIGVQLLQVLPGAIHEALAPQPPPPICGLVAIHDALGS
jgi:hypothetical protein